MGPGVATAMTTDNEHGRVERSYLRFTEVGIQFAATIVALTLLGIWLDKRLGTSPLFTIILLFIGFGAGTWNLIRTVSAPDKATRRKPGNSQ